MVSIKTEGPPPVTAETTLSNAHRWLNIVRFGESGTVIQLQDDCEYRVLEIINNPQTLKDILGIYHKKYILRYLPIDQKDLHKAIKDTLIGIATELKIATKGILSEWQNSEILDEIAKKGYDVGLFISHVTLLLKNHYFQPFFDLELLIRTSKNLSAIAFSELDITHDKYRPLVDKASFLYDHIIKYPMYSETDARQFISHYNNQWNFSLPEKTVSEIIEVCGGYLWLIHHVQRFLGRCSLLVSREYLYLTSGAFYCGNNSGCLTINMIHCLGISGENLFRFSYDTCSIPSGWSK